MNKVFKLDRLYHITFLDHCIGLKETMTCEVVGWCIKDEKDHVVITHWRVLHDDKEMVNNNHEPTVIVKSCIKKKKLLR